MARALDTEEFAVAERVSTEVRANVGEQLRALVAEAGRMGGHGDVNRRVQLVNEAIRRIQLMRARQAQARELGNPTRVWVRGEMDARVTLRAMLMELARDCGLWVAAIDYEMIRVERQSSTGATDNLRGNEH